MTPTDTHDFYRWLRERSETARKQERAHRNAPDAFRRVQLEIPKPPKYGSVTHSRREHENPEPTTERGVCIIEFF